MRSFVHTGRSLIILTALLIPPSASAQAVTEPNTVTITPFISSSFGVSQDLGNSLGLGVAVTYDVTRNLGFEGELGRAFDVLGDNANADEAITTVSANAVYNFDVPRATPYATFGLGFERSGVDVKNPDPLVLYPPSSTEVTYNFGGGVKYPITPQFIVRVDLRRFQANDLAPDHWRLYGGLSWWIKR